MAKRIKRLNVLNTQKVFNLEVREPKDFILVDVSNYKNIEKQLDKFIEKQDELIPERDNKTYRLIYTEAIDFQFVKKLANYAERLSVVYSDLLPVPLIDYIGKFPRNIDTIKVFKEEYSEKEVSNIQQISAALKVSVQHNLEDGENSYAVLSALADVPYIVDELVINYQGKDYKYLYDFFNDIRDPLSGWKVNIIFETASSKQKKYLLERKREDEKEKKSSTVWRKL